MEKKQNKTWLIQSMAIQNNVLFNINTETRATTQQERKYVLNDTLMYD